MLARERHPFLVTMRYAPRLHGSNAMQSCGGAQTQAHRLMNFRQGSNDLDSSSAKERSSPVMLSAAKHLAADCDRPFASLRVTQCDCSNCQGLFFTIETCLNKIIRPSVGADLSAFDGCSDILIKKLICIRRLSS